MKAAWKCKYLKLWRRNRARDSMSMDCYFMLIDFKTCEEEVDG